MTGASSVTSRTSTSVMLSFAGVAVALVIGLFFWMRPSGAAPVVFGTAPPVNTSPAAGLSLPTTPVTSSNSSSSSSSSAGPSSGGEFALRTPDDLDPQLEAKAMTVLRSLDGTGRQPKGYLGGRLYGNDGRNGNAPLPRTDGRGKKISYHEYDVNPSRTGVARGPQRLVVGSDGSAFCTGDRYGTWSRLR